jgi:membrane protease YdiL (CAAX protease family)
MRHAGAHAMQDPEPKRALWRRILCFPLLRLPLLGGGLFWLMMVNNGFMAQLATTPLTAFAVTIGMVLLALALYAGFVRLVEGRAPGELSLPGMGREWAMGAMVGAALYTSSVLLLMALGIYRIEGLNPVSALLPALAMALSAGVFEELVFRGALMRILEEYLGSWIALILSALVFGLTHLLNPAGTLKGALFITIEAGLLLGAAYLLTRRLWMSMGFHISWNYTQSAVFSGIVSGGDSDPGLIRASIAGPELLTGGSFGLEASLIALILCTGTGLLLLGMTVQQGRMRPPAWARRGAPI